MNITKEIITDLFPLYAANECSTDTRALVEDYLRQHPRDADEFHRILSQALPSKASAAKAPAEMASLKRARRLVRQRSCLMALAIFFSLAPFSFIHTGGRTYCLLFESPGSALVYGMLAAAAWAAYLGLRKHSPGV